MDRETIIIATIKTWNIDNALKLKRKYKDNIEILTITNKDELTFDYVSQIKPRYIFFPHWSWIIPKDIYENYECVVFHIADLPNGRGGSPLQNHIIRKTYETKISALRVVKELDAGPIYFSKPIYIGRGSAEEIFIDVSDNIYKEMIPYIFNNHPEPKKQNGKIVNFKRRKPEESDLLLNNFKTIKDLYDFIRMLDGEGYPKAFLELDHFFVELSEVHEYNNKLTGRFEIHEKNLNSSSSS